MQRRRSNSALPTLAIPPSRRILLCLGALILTLQVALIRRAPVDILPHSRVKGGSIGRFGSGAANSMQRPQFILFGDSITQNGFAEGGWAGRLANEYCRKADVVLRGFSGYNSAWALYLLPTIFPVGMTAPALVTIFFGANDAVLKGRSSEKQHVPLEEYVRNLRTIVQHVRSVGCNATVLITPPPVFEQARLIDRQQKFGALAAIDPERTNAVTAQYAASCRQLGAELGIPVLDLWTELQKEAKWSSYLSDGLHLSPSGNRATFRLLQQLIDNHFPDHRQEGMAYDFPVHNDISGSNPSAAFR